MDPVKVVVAVSSQTLLSRLVQEFRRGNNPIKFLSGLVFDAGLDGVKLSPYWFLKPEHFQFSEFNPERVFSLGDRYIENGYRQYIGEVLKNSPYKTDSARFMVMDLLTFGTPGKSRKLASWMLKAFPSAVPITSTLPEGVHRKVFEIQPLKLGTNGSSLYLTEKEVCRRALVGQDFAVNTLFLLMGQGWKGEPPVSTHPMRLVPALAGWGSVRVFTLHFPHKRRLSAFMSGVPTPERLLLVNTLKKWNEDLDPFKPPRRRLPVVIEIPQRLLSPSDLPYEQVVEVLTKCRLQVLDIIKTACGGDN
jgi:hypothetical protein